MLYVSGIGHVTDDKISAEFKKQSWEYAGIKKLHRSLKDNGIIQNSLNNIIENNNGNHIQKETSIQRGQGV